MVRSTFSSEVMNLAAESVWISYCITSIKFMWVISSLSKNVSQGWRICDVIVFDALKLHGCVATATKPFAHIANRAIQFYKLAEYDKTYI